MRRLIATIALIALALPVAAAECGGGTIEWVGQTPVLSRDTVGDGIRYDIVGHVVNYQIDDGETEYAEVPELAERVAVCRDGVTFTVAEPNVEVEPVEEYSDPVLPDWVFLPTGPY